MCYKVLCDESMPQIRGPGKVVEIDESKFGKRKSHIGHEVEGQWVFVGSVVQIEHFFLQPVPSRDQETLIPIIKERIVKGTTIMSDCWKSYDCLSQEDFHHLTLPSLFAYIYIYICNIHLSNGRFIKGPPTVYTQQC